MSSDSAGPTPFIFQTIDSIGEKELDSLPYGVIQLDAQGTVLRYNAYEEGLSGLTRQKVVGKNFFRQIAPCTEMQEFYGRFREGVAAGELHCTFRYHFAFKRNPRDVTVTLLYNAREKLTWVWSSPSTRRRRSLSVKSHAERWAVTQLAASGFRHKWRRGLLRNQQLSIGGNGLVPSTIPMPASERLNVHK